MKRSLLDPLPRQLSTSALAALVALVVCGTGVAVARYLESSRGPIHASPPSVRAAPAPAEWKAPRSSRPSTRGTASYSSRATSPVEIDSECKTRPAAACGEKPVRGVEPTFYRPAEGS